MLHPTPFFQNCKTDLRPLSLSCQATPAQLAAERKVAELHGKLHSCESKIRQLTEELKRARDHSPSFGQVGDPCKQMCFVFRVSFGGCNQCLPLKTNVILAFPWASYSVKMVLQAWGIVQLASPGDPSIKGNALWGGSVSAQMECLLDGHARLVS